MSKIIKVQDMLLKRNPEKYKNIQKRNRKESKKESGIKELKGVIAELEMENAKLQGIIDEAEKTFLAQDKEIEDLKETIVAQDKEIESIEKENEKLSNAMIKSNERFENIIEKVKKDKTEGGK